MLYIGPILGGFASFAVKKYLQKVQKRNYLGQSHKNLWNALTIEYGTDDLSLLRPDP